MSPVLKTLGWRGWVALACGLWLAAGASAQPAPAVQPVEVVPGVWMVQGASALGSPANRNFISNAAFVVTPAGVVVVDALGSPALAQELIAAIARITPQPIRHVIVTHYHADHVYGLQAFKALGATITAHRDGQAYLHSDTARLRLQASREELAPWVNAQTELVPADRWVDGPTRFSLGGVDFVLQPAGPAHTPEDLLVVLPQLGVLIAGDLVFRGRVPFVGVADSGRWIDALQRLMSAPRAGPAQPAPRGGSSKVAEPHWLESYQVHTIVPGHGPASASAESDLALTRDYLLHLRQTMGEAARNLEPFEEAYAKADWSRFERLPLFKVANRINAYNTYLLMEQSTR